MVKLVTPVLGRFSIDFRKLLWRYAVNVCCLNSGWGSFSKKHVSKGLVTMRAWFPMGEPIHGRGSCVLDIAPHWPFWVGAGPCHRERSPIISYLFKDLISKQSHSETLRLGLPHVNCEGTYFISDSPLGMPDTVDTLPITNDRVHIASQQKGYPAPKS